MVWGVRGCPPWSPLVEMYLPGTDEIGFDQKMIWLLILGWLSPLLPTLEAAKEYRVSSGVDNVVWGVRGCPPWSPLVEMYLPGTDEIGFDQKRIWLLSLGWLSPLLPTLEAAKEYGVSLGVDNVVWGVRGCPNGHRW